MTTSKMCYLLPIFLISVGLSVVSSIDIKYAWKYVDYKWESDAQKQEAIASGKYDEAKILLFDAQPLADGRVIVTMPKGFYDNPATIATVSDESGSGGPLVEPYPDWSYHTAEDCSGITHIRKVVVDEYNRMWALDTGTIRGDRVCPAKVLAFDLATDTIVLTAYIPDTIELSYHVEVFDVETTGDSLKNVTLYMSDFIRATLLIWNGADFLSSNDGVFTSDPDQDVLDVGGYTLALSSVNVTGGPTTIETPPSALFGLQNLVFFHPLASTKLYFALRSQLLNLENEAVDYYVSDYTMPHQEIHGAVSSSGIRFGSASTEMTITCWNMLNPLTSDYVKYFDTDEVNLQYSSSLKIFQPTGDLEELWIVSDRVPRWAAGALDLEDYNYRVLVSKIDDLVAGSVCDPANAVQQSQPSSSVEAIAANLDFSLLTPES